MYIGTINKFYNANFLDNIYTVDKEWLTVFDTKHLIYEAFVGELGRERSQKVNGSIQDYNGIDLWDDFASRSGVTKHLHPHTFHQISNGLCK